MNEKSKLNSLVYYKVGSLLSALVLTHVGDKPVHVVISPREDFCYLITVYVPDPAKWGETFTRRKR